MTWRAEMCDAARMDRDRDDNENQSRRPARPVREEKAEASACAVRTASCTDWIVYIEEMLEAIYERIGVMEVSLANLGAALANIETTDSEINTAVTSAGERFKELVTELEALPAPGGVVTQAQVDAITSKASAVASSLQSAATTLSAETPPAKAGTWGSPKEEAKPTKAVYRWDGGGVAPAGGQWTASGFETLSVPPVPLYYFAEDTEPGDTKGVSANWTLYTEATKAVVLGA